MKIDIRKAVDRTVEISEIGKWEYFVDEGVVYQKMDDETNKALMDHDDESSNTQRFRVHVLQTHTASVKLMPLDLHVLPVINATLTVEI